MEIRKRKKKGKRKTGESRVSVDVATIARGYVKRNRREKKRKKERKRNVANVRPRNDALWVVPRGQTMFKDQGNGTIGSQTVARSSENNE